MADHRDRPQQPRRVLDGHDALLTDGLQVARDLRQRTRVPRAHRDAVATTAHLLESADELRLTQLELLDHVGELLQPHLERGGHIGMPLLHLLDQFRRRGRDVLPAPMPRRLQHLLKTFGVLGAVLGGDLHEVVGGLDQRHAHLAHVLADLVQRRDRLRLRRAVRRRVPHRLRQATHRLGQRRLAFVAPAQGRPYRIEDLRLLGRGLADRSDHPRQLVVAVTQTGQQLVEVVRQVDLDLYGLDEVLRGRGELAQLSDHDLHLLLAVLDDVEQPFDLLADPLQSMRQSVGRTCELVRRVRVAG